MMILLRIKFSLRAFKGEKKKKNRRSRIKVHYHLNIKRITIILKYKKIINILYKTEILLFNI